MLTLSLKKKYRQEMSIKYTGDSGNRRCCSRNGYFKPKYVRWEKGVNIENYYR